MTYSKMICFVKIGEDEFFTMDSYETDCVAEFDDNVDDVWTGEDSLQFNRVPETLWSDAPIDQPRDPPEQWVDNLAHEVEISRLLGIGVLQPKSDEKIQAQSMVDKALRL